MKYKGNHLPFYRTLMIRILHSFSSTFNSSEIQDFVEVITVGVAIQSKVYRAAARN